MTLYELDYMIARAIEEAVFGGIDIETGEILDGSFDKLEELNVEREMKLENIGLYIKNTTAEVEALKAEADKLKARAERKSKEIERLKGYVAESMTKSQQDKFETARVAYSFRKSTAVKITNELAIPDDFMVTKIETKPDKKAITAAIKAGQFVAGAELVENRSLQIK